MQLYRYSDSHWANTALLLYLLIGAITALTLLRGMTEALAAERGITGLTVPLLTTITGSLWLAHIMILAAYLAHECMHNTVFKNPLYNDRLGKLLTWLLGAGYIPYRMLKDKHLRHHTERRDVLSLDYRHYLHRAPLIKHTVAMGQWLHIPAAELYSHWLSMISPFFLEEKRHLRSRVIVVALSRLVFFSLLYLIDAALLAGYLVASVIAVAVLGFMDAYQHTYDITLNLDARKQAPEHDRDYEEAHTYSNLLSARFPLLNMLVLNFCYHNVHHWKSGEPWYRLPRLHRQRYPSTCQQEIPLAAQVKNYHRHRMDRIQLDPKRSDEQARRIGASGVSFLVGV